MPFTAVRRRKSKLINKYKQLNLKDPVMVFRGGADLYTARQKVVNLFHRQFGVDTCVPEYAE